MRRKRGEGRKGVEGGWLGFGAWSRDRRKEKREMGTDGYDRRGREGRQAVDNRLTGGCKESDREEREGEVQVRRGRRGGEEGEVVVLEGG